MRFAVALAACALLSACGGAEPPAAATGGLPPGPVLLVGMDGLEWSGVLPLLRERRLPKLAALIERGSFGTLQSIPHRNSPALWTTVATGKDIEKHGIQDFLKSRKPAVFFTSADRRSKAFWNVLSERGRSVATIGWFVTWPAERVSGLMVAQANTGEAMKRMKMKKGALLEGLSGQVYPPEREAAVFEALEGVERDIDNVVAERVPAPLDSLTPRQRELVESNRWAFRADETYLRVALAAAGDRPELLAVYFGATDVVAHRFWPMARPRSFPYARFAQKSGIEWAARMAPGSWTNALLGRWFWRAMEPAPESGFPAQMLFRTYEYADRMLGRLIEAMPKDTRVIVLSDHGFRPWHHVDGPDGFFVAAGPGLRDADAPEPFRLARGDLRRVGRIHDVLPTLLSLLSLPFGQDMDGLPMEGVLQRDPRLQAPRPIPTWDDPEWRAARNVAPAAGADPGAAPDEERLEQLKALGYIQ
jgi:hypothetical protein